MKDSTVLFRVDYYDKQIDIIQIFRQNDKIVKVYVAVTNQQAI